MHKHVRLPGTIELLGIQTLFKGILWGQSHLSRFADEQDQICNQNELFKENTCLWESFYLKNI